VRRRVFIALLGGAAAWPLTARGQQPVRMRRVGVLTGDGANDPEVKPRLTAFEQGLERLGWSIGRDVELQYRFAANNPERYGELAKDLVRLRPDVLLGYTTTVALALARESQTIPIVFASVSDPLGSGLVASLAQPKSNVTGLMLYEEGITGKWLAMLKEISPSLMRAALIADPRRTSFDYFVRTAYAAARLLGIQVAAQPIASATDIERITESFAREPNGGLVVLPGTPI
jgi:putative ABC transport system substrate-binding protein